MTAAVEIAVSSPNAVTQTAARRAVLSRYRGPPAPIILSLVLFSVPGSAVVSSPRISPPNVRCLPTCGSYLTTFDGLDHEHEECPTHRRLCEKSHTAVLAAGRGVPLQLSPMSATEAFGSPLGRVHLACGRVAGGARAIVEAYGFGVSEGPHPEPWTADYHREAVQVYAESLPAPYQRRIGSLFIHSAEAMDVAGLPAGVADDWFIVRSYLRNASAAIADRLAAERTGPSEARATPSPVIDDGSPPRVIHYDRLAALTTVDGTRRLEQAATAVQRHIGAPSAAKLDDVQRKLLNKLADGVPIIDMAADLGYSERTIYRTLDRLYSALGVVDRLQAVRKAATEGLLDG